MTIWIFRLSTLIAFAFLAFRFILPTYMGLLGGLLCGAIVLAGEVIFKRLRLIKIMIGCVGLLIGYALFCFFTYQFAQLPDVLIPQEVVNYWDQHKTIFEFILVLFGIVACLIKSKDLEGISYSGAHLKLADKSALIDGRIVDLCEMGFLTGIIVIPVFILDEVNKMAASSDPAEKAKGKRALDVVTKLQELSKIEVRVTSANVNASSEDEKIVKLAKKLGAQVVTLSFYTSKEATIQNVVSLNVADLAVALKPVVLPGESMNLFIMKEGKEKEQGIGYLDDGTMVVVEDARRCVGKRIEATVYSILQTSTGRMIFASASANSIPRPQASHRSAK